MTSFTFAQQYLVAGSSLVASLPVGCAVGFPSVLLQQLSSNESSIQLDWETTTWIGSIHGVAGIPSIILPAFMQWRGRRLCFILACLVSIIGWILSYIATSSTLILVSESIQGFGSQSILAASQFSLSEMLSPQVRMISMALYLVTQTLGMALVQLLGGYLHWRTVSLVVSAPLALTALAGFIWPDSPSWLAYKGKYGKCARAFRRLRGTSNHAQMELEELILAQKENKSEEKSIIQPFWKRFWQTCSRRDFYLPLFHIFVLLQAAYWSGCIPHVIYGSDIIERATYSKDAIFVGNMIFSSSLVICCIIITVLERYFAPKTLLIGCVFCAVVFLLCASAVNYSQTAGYMSKESYLCFYLLIVYMFSISMLLPIVLPMTAELMPVKHKGAGGPLQVIFASVLHTFSLKSVPYMLKYMNLYGMLLVFATNATLCTLFTWKYIPETKGRTLQQLEDYYNYGNFNKCRRVNSENVIPELIPINE